MQNESTTWSPNVGDQARIKENGLTGTIVKTKGVYEARFKVEVRSTATGPSQPAQAERRRARSASRWYGLAELETPV
jgi:hypothetical protein